MDDTRDSASVDTVTLDDLTEQEIATLLDRLLQLADSETIAEAYRIRTQVEFWLLGRKNVIPSDEDWQDFARAIVSERDDPQGIGEPPKPIPI